jgi:hypothetical protein
VRIIREGRVVGEARCCSAGSMVFRHGRVCLGCGRLTTECASCGESLSAPTRCGDGRMRCSRCMRRIAAEMAQREEDARLLGEEG